MRGLFKAVGAMARLGAPYFLSSEDRWRARATVAAIVVLQLGFVWTQVKLNLWNRDFINAMVSRHLAVWQQQLLVFMGIGMSMVVLNVLGMYLIQQLEIRWRRWMTERYLKAWLGRGGAYRMQLAGESADNPDQRISMDVQMFIERGLNLAFGDRNVPNSLGLLGAVGTLSSFLVILWGLSARTPMPLFGHATLIPGLLVWAALAYALVSTLVTHLIGRRLIDLRFAQQRYEADFRFDLVRVRENAEQIALLRGEPAEERRLMGRFGAVVTNWHELVMRQVKLLSFTAAIGTASLIFPALLVAPAYFAGFIQYGELAQISQAFVTVQGALTFFVIGYRGIAEWKAVADRLDGFERAVGLAEAHAETGSLANPAAARGDNAIRVASLNLTLPDGSALISADPLVLAAGERVLVTGPNGSGKSTTFRALAGIWPFGEGDVSIPEGARVMIAPQRPYLPNGSLAGAIAFPADPAAWPRDEIEEVLALVGLGHFAARLDEDQAWDRKLSQGEQQRLAMARALLHRPDYLFLDEATASLDETSEARLYQLLRDRLPGTALISIGHRTTLVAFHERRLIVIRDGDTNRLIEDRPPKAVAATA